MFNNVVYFVKMERKSEPVMKTICCFDAGAIRGLATLGILNQLEKAVRLRITPHVSESDVANFRIVDCFCMIAGTSTGSIIAAALTDAKQRRTVEEVVELYKENAKQTLKRSWWYKLKTAFGLFGSIYDSNLLAKMCHNVLGNMLLSEAVPPVLIPTYNLEADRPRMFTTLDAKAMKEDYLMADVVRGATAVPVFFAPVVVTDTTGNIKTTCLDGALTMTSPAVIAISEYIRVTQCDLKDTRIVSIGTGIGTSKFSFKWLTYLGSGIATGAPFLGLLAYFGAESTVDAELDRLMTTAKSQDNYYRFNPILTGWAGTVFSYFSIASMDSLYNAGVECVRENDDFDELVDMLASEWLHSTKGIQLPRRKLIKGFTLNENQ